MTRAAVAAPPAVRDEAVESRLAGIPGLGAPESWVRLSNVGAHFDLAAGDGRAHMFSPLDSSFRAAVVLREFPVLYATEFTLCWLCKLLADMGEGAAIHLEIPDEAAAGRRHAVTTDLLRTAMPRGSVTRSGDWTRIDHVPGMAQHAESFRTIYKAFHGALGDFTVRFAAGAAAGATDAEARRSYIYSLFGAHQKSFIFDRVLADRIGRAGLDILDMGGGYGFLGAEMAARGHRVTVVDLKDRHVEIGRWIAACTGLGERLSMRVGRIEDIRRIDGVFDAIGYFGCLLYADRPWVPEVLRESMARLRPGGCLLLHENPRGVIKPGTPDYDICFESDELLTLLRENAGEPAFYNIFTGRETTLEATSGKLIMAVVQKT